MLRRVIVTFFLVAILGLVFAGPAKADGVELQFTYTFGSDVVTWELPAVPPAPPSSFTEGSTVVSDSEIDGTLVEFQPLPYSLNGVPQTPEILDFFNGPSQGGGFQLSVGTTNIILDAFGAQIYGGTGCSVAEQCPSFAPGMFTLTTDIFNNGSIDVPGTLVISEVAAVPEAGTLLLMGTGILAVAGIARRRMRGR